MTTELTYFCPRGCNVFTTTIVDPECAGCGSVMTTDSTSFDNVHERIELEEITRIEERARSSDGVDQPEMEAATLQALKGSIAKWEKIVAGTGADGGRADCPLCSLFYEYDCAGCPVAAST